MIALSSIDDPRMPPVTRRSVATQLGDVPAAEPLLALEIGAEPDVQHPLVDDRVHRRLLRPRTDRADRAADRAHRLEQPDVDDVGRVRIASTIPSPSGRRLDGAETATGSATRIGHGRVDAGRTRPRRAAAGDRRGAALDRAVERVAFGDGHLGGRTPRLGRCAATCAASSLVAIPRRRHAGATPRASSSPVAAVRRTRDSAAPTTVVPSTADGHPEPVAQPGGDQRVPVRGVGRAR